jgi:hypothetical protein
MDNATKGHSISLSKLSNDFFAVLKSKHDDG